MLLFPIGIGNLSLANGALNGNFKEELEASTEGLNLQIFSSKKWTDWFSETMLKILDIVQPIILSVGVLIAFIWAYKIMSSEDPEKIKSWGLMVAIGVIGIIIIVSANFIGNTLVNDVIVGWSEKGSLNGIWMATNLYEKLLLPFLKVAMYLSMGFLFFVLAARVFSFLTSPDEGVKAKAGGMILWATIGIAIIMLAKEVVTAIFWKRDEVLRKEASNLWEMGNALFDQDLQSSLPLAYTIINRVMGLTSLAVLIMIIVQTIMILTKPDDPELVSKIKKTIIYIFVGVIIIGAGYLISNVLLIDGQNGDLTN